MNMVFLYYDNPRMLAEQIKYWNSYVGVLRNLPEILLIDDGSPKTFAADIVRQVGCKLPIRIFRIKEDIAWNFSGARNLGCTHADSWIYVSDIDTLLTAAAAQLLFEEQPLKQECFYRPRRIWLPDSREASPAIVNLLFHKQKYLEIGGYDGREETDFHGRLKRVAGEVYRPDVVIQAVPPSLIADARSKTSRSRDKARNALIYARKALAGFPTSVNPLRFSWERVL
jgi:hypothetical protein